MGWEEKRNLMEFLLWKFASWKPLGAFGFLCLSKYKSMSNLNCLANKADENVISQGLPFVLSVPSDESFACLL